MENKFKKGDKVFSLLRGWGEVEHNDNIGDYPLFVKFLTRSTKRYTADGKFFEKDINPELYHTEPTITVPKRRVEHKGWIGVRNTKLFSNDDQRVITNICDSEEALKSNYPVLNQYTIQEITYYTEE